MARTRVINIRDGYSYDVYIGRAMPGYEGNGFGNPFHIGPDGTREEVIAKYRAMILRHPKFIQRVSTLKGKVLGCWCAPDLCHGDVLAEIADSF